MAKKKVATLDEASVEDLLGMLADPETENKKGLRQKLSAMLGNGAVPCKQCGEAPHAMLRRPAVGDNLPIYEVGCLVHGNARRGDEPSAAVQRWNTAQSQKD